MQPLIIFLTKRYKRYRGGFSVKYIVGIICILSTTVLYVLLRQGDLVETKEQKVREDNAQINWLRKGK